MKIRPGAVAETLLALACGAALSYAADIAPAPPFNLETVPWRVAYLVEPFLTGVALVAGLGLLIEAARRRSPETWGLGRWTWGLSGFYLLLEGLVVAAQFAIYAATRKIPGATAKLLLQDLQSNWRFSFIQEIVFILIAFLIARRLARLPGDPAPDARERAGRMFLGLALAWGIGFRAMVWAGI